MDKPDKAGEPQIAPGETIVQGGGGPMVGDSDTAVTRGALPAGDSVPRASPGTDPTNPYRQESAGIFVAPERASERRVNEEGLTDEDRDRRRPTL